MTFHESDLMRWMPCTPMLPPASMIMIAVALMLLEFPARFQILAKGHLREHRLPRARTRLLRVWKGQEDDDDAFIFREEPRLLSLVAQVWNADCRA